MRHFKIILVLFFALLSTVSCTISQDKPILIVNEDDSNFYKLSGKYSEDELTEEFVRNYIRQFKDTNLTHFFMCPNAQRAGFKSKVKQAIWEPSAAKLERKKIDKDAYIHTKQIADESSRWLKSAKIFHDKNLDVYKIWIDECRKMGISPWISMRMNDIHFPHNLEYHGHDKFWINHPELQRAPKAKIGTRWENWSLNYKYKKVRDYQLAFVRELFERYDFDGIELDWTRFTLHLTPFKGEEEAHILTDFVSEVKNIAKEFEKFRGRKIKIAVRVLPTPDASRFIGLDAVDWANKSLIDMIVPTGNWATTDFDVPVYDWKNSLSANAKNVKVIVASEDGNSAFPGAGRVRTTVPALNGFAANSYHNGSDGIYYFNLIYHREMFSDILKQGVAKDTIRNVPRRHIVTYRNLAEPRNKSDMQIQLPQKIDKPRDFKIQLGDLPDTFKNEKIYAIVGIPENKGYENAKFDVALNDIPALYSEDIKDKKHFKISPNKKGRAIKYTFLASAAKNGHNELTISPKEGDTQTVTWIEVDILPVSKATD